MAKSADHRSPRHLTQMRVASLIEGTTLVILLFVAVPLKHLFGLPIATSLMGPIHGLAFVFYVWTLSTVASDGAWSRSDIVWMSIAAVVPFGAFFNERVVARRQTARLRTTAR